MKNSKTGWIWIVAAIGAIISASAWVYWLFIRDNFGDYSGRETAVLPQSPADNSTPGLTWSFMPDIHPE